MSGRGLGATMGAPPRMRTRGSGLQPQLAGLEHAVATARGRLDGELLDAVQASVVRSTERLRLSDSHTIVAIAGATGSGKSTIFNALAGIDLSTSGPQRPTTSTTKALVWSDDDLEEMLEWLGVPASNQHPRRSLPEASHTRLPEGLLLLDLPDHDSIQVAHHLEAERIVELADLLIWVVDPQKYADAAIHHRFLQPLAGPRAVTMVVLNHIDLVPEGRRKGMLRDLRKLLVADGMRDPRILATSAKYGTGMKELRTAIRRRVEEKQNAGLRVEADIRAAARRLQRVSGDAPTSVPPVWVADLEKRVAAAAGVPALVAATEQVVRRDAAHRMRLPGLRRGGPGPSNRTSPLRQLGPVDRPAVDTAVRNLVAKVTRDLTPAWARPVWAAAAERLKETDDRLDAELAALRFEPRLPRWLSVVTALRAVLAVGIVAGVIVVGAAALRGGAPTVPSAVLGALLGIGAAVQLVARHAAQRVAARESAAVADECRRVIARVVRGHVLAPVCVELATYARFRKGVTSAKA